MDSIDKKILNILQTDAKIANATLAERVALSPSACLRRVQHMEEQGIIEKYVTIVNGKSIGKGVQIMLLVTLTRQENQYLQQFEDAVLQIPNVMACYLIGGEYDYIIRVEVADLDDYADLHRNTISLLPHVAKLQSNFAMREVVRKTDYYLSP